MHVWSRLAKLVGGNDRAKVIAVLACVLGLDAADVGAVGSMARPLQHALAISKTEVGLLLTASLGVGALATLPFGVLVDRVDRTHLLSWAIAVWGGAMVLSGCATGYVFLLVTRMLLGGVTACAAPAVASLVGDSFTPEERGRVYGWVLSGELFGTALGFVLSGGLASWSWRAGFVALAVPAFVLAWALRRLKEPARGGASRFPPMDRADADRGRDAIRRLVRERHVEPRPKLRIEGDPRRRPAWWSFGYVLRIPTNVVLIVASSLAYFYFAGIRTFGLEYVHARYGLSHGWSITLLVAVGAGAIAGVLVAGRLADRLVQRGHLRARVGVAACAYFLAVAFLVPALLSGSLWIGIVLFTFAGAALGAMNPPLDSARLDIMVPGLWGRAESVRVFLRKAGEAGAPFAFGLIAEHVFGDASGSGRGLHATFLLMLVALGAAGAVALVGLRTYPRDVASAEENAR